MHPDSLLSADNPDHLRQVLGGELWRVAPAVKCRVRNHSRMAGVAGATLEGLWWWGSAGCRFLRESDTAGWVLCSGVILSPLISLLWWDHISLEAAVLHSVLLTALPAVLQWVGILISSTHARAFPGEEAHAQRFPGAAASHLNAGSLWFHLQFHYNVALCWLRFEKLATVVDPTHDRVEKGSV